MTSLYINLLNFRNDKLAGVGYFFKRIVSNIDFDGEEWAKVNEIVVLVNGKINVKEVFGIKECRKLRIVELPFTSNFLLRILVEQLILPILLFFKKGVFYSPTPAVPVLMFFLNKKLRLIPTIHDMIPFYVKTKYGTLRSKYVKLISKLAGRYSYRVITVSEYSKADLCKICRISEEKVVIVYNFIPELVFKCSFSKEKYFVTVCTIEPGKNLETMLLGFRKFLDSGDYSDYKYYVIGQFGWGYSSLMEYVKSLMLDKNVVFKGYLPDEEKNRLISNSCGMIYLSRYEGFGIPPLEAMYFNKVSIVSNSSSLPEVVGEAGITQEWNDSDTLATNFLKLITESGNYEASIPDQLNKFSPVLQINVFTRNLTQAFNGI